MVSNINNTDLNNVQQVISEMYKKLKAADTDGVDGLSKKELASINTSNKLSSAFLQTLSEQFDKLDADKNGQLSKNDLETAISRQFSHQEIAATTFNNNNLGNLSNFGSTLGSFSKSLTQKILSEYKNSDLLGLASSLKA